MRRCLLWWLPLIVMGCTDNTYCESCDLVLEEAVGFEDAGFTMSTRLVRTTDGGFAAIGTYDPERIIRFDGRGRIVRTAGRKGSGPGEFSHLSNMVVANGDSLIVVDGPRIHFLDGELSWSHTVLTPRMPRELLVLPDGSIVGHPGSPSSRLPLLYRLHPDSAAKAFWFHYPANDIPLSGIRLIAAHDGEIWSIGRVTLDIHVFDSAGHPIREFHVNHPWFGSQEPDGSVRVEDVVHESSGGLLMLVARERPNWEPPRARGSGEGVPVQLTTEQFIDRWEQQILMITRDGELLFTSRPASDVALLGFADDEHLYGFMGEDELLLKVWRARLHVPSTTQLEAK